MLEMMCSTDKLFRNLFKPTAEGPSINAHTDSLLSVLRFVVMTALWIPQRLAYTAAWQVSRSHQYSPRGTGHP